MEKENGKRELINREKSQIVMKENMLLIKRMEKVFSNGRVVMHTGVLT